MQGAGSRVESNEGASRVQTLSPSVAPGWWHVAPRSNGASRRGGEQESQPPCTKPHQHLPCLIFRTMPGSAAPVWLVVLLPILLPVAYSCVRNYSCFLTPVSEDDRLYNILPHRRTATQTAYDAAVSANLGTAELAARRLTSRLTSASILVGSVSFLCMVMPIVCNFLVAREDYLVWAANGGSYFVAFGLAQAPCTPPPES